jgi:hypothetical protein
LERPLFRGQSSFVPVVFSAFLSALSASSRGLALRSLREKENAEKQIAPERGGEKSGKAGTRGKGNYLPRLGTLA